MTRSALATLLLALYPFRRRGRKKLVRFIARHLNGYMLWRGRYGVRYLLNPKNYIDQRILRDGVYEGELVAHFCNTVTARHCDAFIDVGANIGVYTFAFLHQRPGCAVLAFEPDPLNHNQMAANILLNGLDTAVRLRPEALSSENREGVLNAQRDSQGLSTVQSSLEDLGVVTEPIAVNIIAFDDHWQWQGRRVAIKMDIEGHELEALKGMRNLLANNRVFLQVESFDKNLPTLRALMAGCGFRELPQLSPNYHDYYFTNMNEA